MNTSDVILDNFRSYEWNARMYGVLSAASRVAATVKNRTNVIKLAYRLRTLNKLVTDIVDNVNAGMEGKLPPPAKDEKPLTPQQIREQADRFEHLHRMLEYIYESLRRVGLTNNSLTAASLSSIHRHTDAIANFADWLDLASQPEQVESLFTRAKQEKERGELIDLAQVE